MPVNHLKERTRSGTKSAWTCDVYRRMLRTPELTDQEIDDMRKHVIRLAQVLCEHVWGKRFY
jgi:hypothetical protein